MPAYETCNHVHRITQDFTLVQENTSHNFTSRLENLKLRRDLTDEELALKVGLSRRMLYLIRIGKSSITRKTWYKLEQAEIDAGIRAGAEIREDAGVSDLGEYKKEMLSEMGGIQKDLVALSRRVDDFVKRLK